MDNKQIKEKVIGGIKKAICGSSRTIDRITRIGYIIVILVLLSVVHKSCQSDVSGDFSFYERDPETGKVEVFKFSGRKKAPPVNNKNLIEINVGSDLSRDILYKRNVIDLWGIQGYAGGGVGQDVRGHTVYKAGITLTF